MTDYTILVDGERAASIDSDSAVRAWIAMYREDHADDDPAAAHVQILERGAFAWLTGGKLIDRERFL
jgi:hypothetical protein